MLNVSEKAAAFLLEGLQSNSEGDQDVLRLVQAEDGLALTVDQEREGDQVVEHSDRKVLVIESGISNALDGATLETVDTPEGERLTLTAPEQA